MTNKKSLIQSSLAVTAVMIVTKVFGFGRDMLIANYLGTSSESDIFYLALGLISAFTGFVASPLSASYLPIATDVYCLKEDHEKKHFLEKSFGGYLLIGIGLSIVFEVVLKFFLPYIVPGFSMDKQLLLKNVLTLQIAVIPLMLIDVICASNLKIHNKIGFSEVSNAIIALTYITYIFVQKKNITLYGLALCGTIAYLISFLIKYIFFNRDVKLTKWRFDFWKNESISKVNKAMIPFMLAGGAKEINSLIDRAISSILDEGSITIQAYASKLTVTEVGLIATAVSMVVYAQAAKCSSQNDTNALKETTKIGAKFVNTFLFPCTMITIIFSKEIITVLFGRGEFSNDAINKTAITMIIYAIGMLGAGLEEIYTRLMHATKHRKFPAVVSTITVFLNTILNLLLYKPFGVYGIAAASTFVFLIKVPFYYKYIDKKIINLSDLGIWRETLKIGIVSIVGSIIIYALKGVLMHFISNVFLILIVGVIFSIIVFYIGLLAIGNEFAKDIRNTLRFDK